MNKEARERIILHINENYDNEYICYSGIRLLFRCWASLSVGCENLKLESSIHNSNLSYLRRSRTYKVLRYLIEKWMKICIN